MPFQQVRLHACMRLKGIAVLESMDMTYHLNFRQRM